MDAPDVTRHVAALQRDVAQVAALRAENARQQDSGLATSYAWVARRSFLNMAGRGKSVHHKSDQGNREDFDHEEWKTQVFQKMMEREAEANRKEVMQRIKGLNGVEAKSRKRESVHLSFLREPSTTRFVLYFFF